MTTSGPRHEHAQNADDAAGDHPGPPEQWWVVNSSGLDGLIPEQRQFVPRDETPDTIAGWKALVESRLTNQCCAFHRNMEISSRYAWMYKLQPASFKWAAMAACASHHVRFVLFPLRLDTDGTGYVDIPHALRAHTWPRITRLDDRWRWLEMSVVPRFRRLDANRR